MDTNLKKLHNIELDILRHTLDICNKHNLTYYMLGGTLLGAIRHKGFIPWDDDIDIGIPRPDYDRFIEFAEKELKDPYQLHTTLNMKGQYSYYYARIENKKVKLQRYATNKKLVIPAWIDVFPLDGVPNDDNEMRKWLKECKFWRKIYTLSQASFLAASDSYKKKQSFLLSFGRTVFLKLRFDRFINTKWAWRKFDKVLRKNDYDNSNRIINYCGNWGIKEMFSKSVYGKGTLYQFEDLWLNGPDDYNFVLTQMYGDYMTPPNENDRDRHHLKIIEI